MWSQDFMFQEKRSNLVLQNTEPAFLYVCVSQHTHTYTHTHTHTAQHDHDHHHRWDECTTCKTKYQVLLLTRQLKNQIGKKHSSE